MLTYTEITGMGNSERKGMGFDKAKGGWRRRRRDYWMKWILIVSIDEFKEKLNFTLPNEKKFDFSIDFIFKRILQFIFAIFINSAYSFI